MSANINAYILAKNIVFTDDEKRECLEITSKLVDIAIHVRKNGLLALEDKIASYDNLFLKKAIQYAVDAFTAEVIRENLEDCIIFDNSTGKELLERILILEGTILIVNGNNPRIVKNNLGNYFGLSFAEEYEKYFSER